MESLSSLWENPMPWLLFSRSTNDVHAFSTAPFDNEPNIRNIPELQGRTICASQFGWLVLLEDNPDTPHCYCFTLWNPVTSKSIILPPLSHDYPHHAVRQSPRTCLLSSPPHDEDNDDGVSNCFLFLWFALSERVFVCRCQPRRGNNNKNSWYSQRMEIEGERVELHGAVALNGVIYIRSFPRAPPGKEILISLKIVDDDVSNPFTLTHLELEEVDISDSHHLCVSFSCLVDSCGSIYLIQAGVHNCDGAHAAKVWELDLQQRTWVEVKCLGDRAFFIFCGNTAGGWAITTGHCKSSRGIEANCLYIYDVEMGKGGVVMYSLKDCSSTLLPCGTDNTWRDFVFWVMPQHLWIVGGQEGNAINDDQHNDVSKSCLIVGSTECQQLLQQNEPQAERLSELPRDLIELLSRYVHLFDYGNFRCTSKLIQSAMPLPLWRTNNLFPLFLVFENDGGLCRVMDPCRDDFRSCNFQLYGDNHFDILYSKDGWVLVSDRKTFQFFNPFTREKGDLPNFCSMWHNSIGFSTNPTCSKCLTVSISSAINESGMTISYFKSGDTQWTCHAFEDSHPSYFDAPSGSPIYHSGAFYWLFSEGHLGVLEMADKD